MTRYSFVFALALVALLGFATTTATAGAQEGEYDTDVIFFFGECEEEEYEELTAASGFLDGCLGFGIFIGAWDRESILAEIAYEAVYEFGGAWQVEKIKALNLGHPEESFFGFDTYECIEEPFGETSGGGDPWGVWIVFFSVEPCAAADPAWGFLEVSAFGCADSSLSLLVEFSGIEEGSGLAARTVATAGGQTYMDQEFSVNSGINGEANWSIFDDDSGGPTNGTFPIPNDTEVVIELRLVDGVGGPIVGGTRVTLVSCNSGQVSSTEPLPDV